VGVRYFSCLGQLTGLTTYQLTAVCIGGKATLQRLGTSSISGQTARRPGMMMCAASAFVRARSLSIWFSDSIGIEYVDDDVMR
jgi:hypothetical protein